MSPVLGNAIVILALIVLVYFCGRNCINMLKDELSGKCTGCANGCSHSSPAGNAVSNIGGCTGNCAGCAGCKSRGSDR